MTSTILLIVAICGLFVTQLTATGLRVMRDIHWHELKEYAKRRKNRARFDDIHDHHVPVATAVESLLVVFVSLLSVGAVVCWQSSPQVAAAADLLDVLVLLIAFSVVLLAVVVWIPHAIADVAGTAFLYHTWRHWFLLSHIFAPMTYGVRWIKWISHRLAGGHQPESEEEAFDEEIRAIATEGNEDGLLEDEELQMIEGVIELDKQDVADIMTPRSEMDVIAENIPLAELLDLVVHSGRTRIPIYGKNKDDIIGILYVKDLIGELAVDGADDCPPIQAILRKPWFVPQTQKLDELLRSFLKTRNHLAIVVDEYMNVAGLVTIEDVLEEIVGEIVDESDKEELSPIQRISEGEYELKGSVHLDELNEQLGVDIPEDEDYDTIAGFLLAKLKHIPENEEEVHWNRFRFVVTDANKRKIRKLKMFEALDSSNASNENDSP